MKALLINGSPNEFGCTYTALEAVRGALERRGVEAELLWLGRGETPGCMGCGACRRLGRCVIDDKVNEVIGKIDGFDALVIGAPVHYAGPAAQACAFMDRLFFSSARRLQGKLGAAVVSCRRGGATASLDRLNKYFLINNMPLVSSQYWCMVHGNEPEEVLRDAEGMQIMRSLGENMAWLLKSLEAGRKSGVPAPEYEPRVATNFIR